MSNDIIYRAIDLIYQALKTAGAKPRGARAQSARQTTGKGSPTQRLSQTGARGADRPT